MPSFKVTRAVAALATLSAAASIQEVFAANDAHRIESLPGWDDKLPSNMYAGYVDAGGDSDGYQMYEHYYFVESEGDPKNDPLVVWTNGGPGASSLFGLFVELGPFLVNNDSLQTKSFKSTGVPSLFRNPFSWSKHANLLILNSPPPVGYSYCDPVGPTGDGFSCGTWNDERTAHHNRVFLENWLKEFPEYSKHDWYITGESYAGIYVPTLVRELLDRHETFPIEQLKGFAVGDGCVGTDINCAAQGPYFTMEFLHGHGQFSDKLYHEIRNTCTEGELYNGVTNPKCAKLIDRMNAQVGGYYEYNLYDECWKDSDFQAVEEPENEVAAVGRRLGAVNDYKCGGQKAMNLWLDHAAVRETLHVSPTAKFFSGDNGVGFKYDMTEKNLLSFYRRAILETNLRVIVYNGDTDPGLNSIMAQNWTSSLNIQEKEEWRPWTLDGGKEVAGYVTRYKNDFDFLTIRGSGHMVPEFKPAAAYEFFSKWLNNEEYQRYNPKKKPSQVEVDEPYV